jgi:putative ABC transport system substrate-binding protein
MAFLGGAAAVWPLAANAQQPERMRRVAAIVSGAESDPEMNARALAFRQGLEQLGWSEGRNVHVDYRFVGSNADQHQALARELVALQPDVILTQTTPITAAVQRESRTIPIVFANVSDPVGAGLIASLARPGGNLTGLLLYEDGITGKWLALLKEIAPQLRRIAFMANPKTTPYDYFLRSAKAIAPSLGIEVVPSHVSTAVDIERAIESFAHVPNTGLMVPPDATSILHRDSLIALTARHRLPAVYPFRFFVTGGGLMCYGIDVIDQYRRAASYVDRILRGAKPADLPVQAPTKFETIVNLRTAKALGLEVPPTLLVRADEVIE